MKNLILVFTLLIGVSAFAHPTRKLPGKLAFSCAISNREHIYILQDDFDKYFIEGQAKHGVETELRSAHQAGGAFSIYFSGGSYFYTPQLGMYKEGRLYFENGNELRCFQFKN